MISALLVLALSQAPCSAADRGDERRGCRARGDVQGPSVTLAPAAGIGLPYAQGLCDYALAHGYNIDGGTHSSLCVQNGTQRWGDALAAVGSPSNTSVVVCPTGPDCATETTRMNDAAEGDQEPTAAAFPATDVTVVVLRQAPALSFFTAYGTTGASFGTYVWYMLLGASGRLEVGSSTGTAGAGTVSSPVGTLAVAGGWHCLVMSYQRVGAGTSNLKSCVDGACTTLATAGLFGSLSSKTGLNGYMDCGSDSCVPASTRGYLVSYQYLTDAQIDAMCSAILADAPTGTRGEPIALTRTGAHLVMNSASTGGSVVPANRGGVAGSKWLETQPPATNYLTQARAAESAPWGSTGITITPNYALAADGTLTARRVEVPACPSTTSNISVNYNANPGAGTYTSSMIVKATSSACTISICPYSTGGTIRCTQCTVPAGRWTTPEECSDANETITATDGYFQVGCVNWPAIYPGSADTGACDFLWSSAQWERNVSATSHVLTSGATAARGAPLAPMTLTNMPTLRSCEATVTLGASVDAVSSSVFATLWKDATHYGEFYFTSDRRARCYWQSGASFAEAITTGSLPLSASSRVSCSWDGATIRACLDGACNTAALAASTFDGATALYPGTYQSTGFEIGPSSGVSNVRCSPNPGAYR